MDNIELLFFNFGAFFGLSLWYTPHMCGGTLGSMKHRCRRFSLMLAPRPKRSFRQSIPEDFGLIIYEEVFLHDMHDMILKDRGDEKT